jgi:hypothetical protein
VLRATVAYMLRSSRSTYRCVSSATTKVSLPPSFDAAPAVAARNSPPPGRYNALADWYCRAPEMPLNTSGCTSGPHSAITNAAVPNVCPAWLSSVASALISGPVTGRPTGCPPASHPSNRTGPRASATANNPASSDLARPFGRDNTARSIARRPVPGSNRYAPTRNRSHSPSRTIGSPCKSPGP